MEREDQKVISAEDTIKTGLQIERTWFKWLFTGLHIGSYGTWVIKFFAANDGTTLFIVIASWIVAFGVILFGLEIYYNRRRFGIHVNIPPLFPLFLCKNSFARAGNISHNLFCWVLLRSVLIER